MVLIIYYGSIYLSPLTPLSGSSKQGRKSTQLHLNALQATFLAPLLGSAPFSLSPNAAIVSIYDFARCP